MELGDEGLVTLLPSLPPIPLLTAPLLPLSAIRVAHSAALWAGDMVEGGGVGEVAMEYGPALVVAAPAAEAPPMVLGLREVEAEDWALRLLLGSEYIMLLVDE